MGKGHKMSESPVKKKARKEIAEAREYEKGKLKPLEKRLSAMISSETDAITLSLTHDELEQIKVALRHYACTIRLGARRREFALDCGSEDGNLNSHCEKHILDGCIGLLCDAGEQFREYLDFVGFEPSSDEEKLHINFSLSHIVNRLFLWHTFHSGGTSTSAKCRELGADPYDEIDICEENENDDG